MQTDPQKTDGPATLRCGDGFGGNAIEELQSKLSSATLLRDSLGTRWRDFYQSEINRLQAELSRLSPNNRDVPTSGTK